MKETALDALEVGLDTAVASSLVRAVELEPGDGDRALHQVRERGGRIA